MVYKKSTTADNVGDADKDNNNTINSTASGDVELEEFSGDLRYLQLAVDESTHDGGNLIMSPLSDIISYPPTDPLNPILKEVKNMLISSHEGDYCTVLTHEGDD